MFVSNIFILFTIFCQVHTCLLNSNGNANHLTVIAICIMNASFSPATSEKLYCNWPWKWSSNNWDYVIIISRHLFVHQNCDLDTRISTQKSMQPIVYDLSYFYFLHDVPLKMHWLVSCLTTARTCRNEHKQTDFYDIVRWRRQVRFVWPKERKHDVALVWLICFSY